MKKVFFSLVKTCHAYEIIIVNLYSPKISFLKQLQHSLRYNELPPILKFSFFIKLYQNGIIHHSSKDIVNGVKMENMLEQFIKIPTQYVC